MEYNPRLTALLARNSLPKERWDKEYPALHSGSQENVIFKLDQFKIGTEEELRRLRKKITNKAQRMLHDFEGKALGSAQWPEVQAQQQRTNEKGS